MFTITIALKIFCETGPWSLVHNHRVIPASPNCILIQINPETYTVGKLDTKS